MQISINKFYIYLHRNKTCTACVNVCIYAHTHTLFEELIVCGLTIPTMAVPQRIVQESSSCSLYKASRFSCSSVHVRLLKK